MKRNILLTGLISALTASSFAQGGKTPERILLRKPLELHDGNILLFLGTDEMSRRYLGIIDDDGYICALMSKKTFMPYFNQEIDLRTVFEESEQWYSVTEYSITPMDKDESFLPDSGYFAQKDSLSPKFTSIEIGEKKLIQERPKIDAPVVMVCRNRWEQYYMCVFLESRTIALKVNDNLLNAYFSKKISLRKVFLLADTWFNMDGVMEEMKRDNTLFPDEFYHKEFNRGVIESETFQPLTDYISSRCALDVLPWLGIVEKEKIVLLAEKKREFQRGRKK